MARILNGRYVDSYWKECVETFKLRTKTKAGKRAFVSYVATVGFLLYYLWTTPDQDLFTFGSHMHALAILIRIGAFIAALDMAYILFFMPE